MTQRQGRIIDRGNAMVGAGGRQRISQGRQQMVRVVKTVQVTTGKYTWGNRSEMSDGAKQDFAVSARKCAAYIYVCVCV